jgi:hypothetical protein
MSELDKAREHLLYCQKVLQARRYLAFRAPFEEDLTIPENNVLAALSWVWECQKRKRSVKRIK